MKKIILSILIFQCSLLIVQAQWIQQTSGVTSPLYDIEFINKNTGWSCGEGGIILKTTNGGINWNTQITNVPNKPLFGIHPVNENVVYSVGWFGTILKTTNGGDHWLAIENGVVGDGNYFCVFFLNEELGWIGENNNMGQGDVKKTTDGGMTFTSSFTFGWPYDLYFKDSLNGVGVDGAATIHRTTNSGTNWISFTIAGTGDFYRVSFIDGYTGFVIGGASEILYKTTNFGQNWNSISFIPNVTGYSTSIEFINDNTGWVGGTNELYKTTNEGFSWVRQNVSPGVLYTIQAVTDSLVWACGNGGRIWHTNTGGDTITNIKQISSVIPGIFELKQNYPNPFNPDTKIEFDIKENGIYKLEIFDITGKKVEEIFNERFSTGTYQVIYLAYNMTSGVYIYKLSSIKFSQSKKFLLIK